jgi:GxxExxY protein
MSADGAQIGAVGGDDLFPDLTRRIIGAAFEVHNELGPGFLEKVYENALVMELRRAEIDVTAQAAIPVTYKGTQVGMYYADLLVDGKVIVEIKAADTLTAVHEAQLLHYLKATGIELGLLLNFATRKVQIRRMARSNPK